MTRIQALVLAFLLGACSSDPYHQGSRAILRDDVAAAISLFEQAVAAAPDWAPARYSLAGAHEQAEDWEAVLEALGPVRVPELPVEMDWDDLCCDHPHFVPPDQVVSMRVRALEMLGRTEEALEASREGPASDQLRLSLLLGRHELFDQILVDHRGSLPFGWAVLLASRRGEHERAWKLAARAKGAIGYEVLAVFAPTPEARAEARAKADRVALTLSSNGVRYLASECADMGLFARALQLLESPRAAPLSDWDRRCIERYRHLIDLYPPL